MQTRPTHELVAFIDCRYRTDAWPSSTQLERVQPIVKHADYAWARAEEGGGIREVPINSAEGLWITSRHSLRPFRGVHKRYLPGHIAIGEFATNFKTVAPKFITAITTTHHSLTCAVVV
jgi:hypothetical protein